MPSIKYKNPQSLELGFDMEKKDKGIEAEFHLPEAIIQHIQSFLTAKEAAQTTLLSKSWYAAWLTRPTLDFDYRDFERKSGTEDEEKRFAEFVEKTVERYEKLNLKIHSLRLWTYVYYIRNGNHYFHSLVSKWIEKALKMGATCLDFKIYNVNDNFALPHQVFESENLKRLSVGGCKISLGAEGKVSCWRLKSLTLNFVDVEGDVVRDIISSCPLIENLSLYCFLRGRNMGSADSPFIKLKSLLLYKIDVGTLFFHDFSSKFPCLKDLSLDDCGIYKGIQISSLSLECISFEQDTMLRVKFDVPNIRKFTFSGKLLPSFSFKTTSSNWEYSNISITYGRLPRATWFVELNKLLTKLSPSKVSLSLEICSRKRLDCPEDIKCLNKPEVENLTIDLPVPNSPALLDCLFRCCRPICVTQYWSKWGNSRINNCDFIEIVYKRVIQQVGTPGECNLLGVDVEFFDEAVSEWRPRLADASTSPGADEQRIRLHLRWRR